MPGSSRAELEPAQRTVRGAPLLVGWAAGLTLVMLWPVLTRPGFVLSYDMVFVPDQPLKPWMWGAGDAPPRAVPQDLYVALLDDVIPGWLLQRCLLAGGVLLAALGMAVLTHPLGRVGQLVAMTCYVWSAWVFERLVIGHWGLLIAFAALPWVLRLAAQARTPGSRRAGGMLVLVVFAGTWVPSGGVLVGALAVAVLLWPGPGRRPWVVLLGVLLVQLSWLVPAIRAAGLPQPSGAVFGVAGDGGSGPLLTALAGSGIWNPATVPTSRSGALAWVAAFVVLVGVIAGFKPLVRGLGRPLVLPLVLIATVALGWAVLTGVSGARVVVVWFEDLPGGGLLRDGQKWLAPWWLLVSMSCGAAAAHLRTRTGPGQIGRLAAVTVLVPIVLLPDLAGGAGGRLQPHSYPVDWDEVSRILAGSDDGTALVSLPWSAFRRYAWNSNRVVLDPAPRYLPGAVVAGSDLLVRGPGGVLTLPSDDPADQAVAEALTSGTPAVALARLGVGWILVHLDQPKGPLGEDTSAPTVAEPAYVGSWLRLDRLPGAAPPGPAPGFPWARWLVISVVLAGAGLAASGRKRRSSPA